MPWVVRAFMPFLVVDGGSESGVFVEIARAFGFPATVVGGGREGGTLVPFLVAFVPVFAFVGEGCLW